MGTRGNPIRFAGERRRQRGGNRPENRFRLCKRARRPVPLAARGDQPIHDVDEGGGACRTEFDDPQVLAVRLRRVHSLGHVDDPAASNLDLHLLVAEQRLVGLAIREEQRVVVTSRQKIVEQHRMENYVTI